MTELGRLLRLARRHRGKLAGGSLLLLGDSATTLAVPWIAGLLAGSIVTGNAAAADFRMLLLAMLALFALQGILRFASVCILAAAAHSIVADLKVRLYDHLQALPLAFYHRRRLGDTLALLTNDVHVVGEYLAETVVSLLPLLVTAIGAMVFMLHIRVDLAILATALIPLFYLCMKVVRRKLRPLAAQLQQAHADAVAMVHENLSMIPAIKTFTREAHESARYRGQVDRILALSARHWTILAALGPAVHFVTAAAVLLVLGLAFGDISTGRLDAARLVTFLMYAQLLARPVSGLADVYGRTQVANGALVRLRAAMDETPEPPPHVGVPLPAVRGHIQFQGTSYAHEGRPRALHDVNLEIQAGETIAIVGPNGAGKSTLAHLLMRLHEPSAGRILVDGADIATVSLPSLRAQIGVVPQHVLLFNETVHDNIAYGRRGADQAAIESAARAARAHDFIIGLPMGYETVIGDRGVRLSGGQQQRIALARALLKDPPILILDEATSMFDPRGEEEFLHASRDSMRRRTVILITHRPASLAVADRIVHMDGGRIVRVEQRRDMSVAESPGR